MMDKFLKKLSKLKSKIKIPDDNYIAEFSIFQKIYENRLWGGGSGSGSRPKYTIKYRQFIMDFLKEHNIKSVLDYGCGDWQSSKLINWDGIKYIGIDVVPSVIEKNKNLYGKNNIKFCLNSANFKIPKVDLIIIKDVAQHLPIVDILKLIKSFSKVRHILWVNDLSRNNIDIKRGQYRGLDLSLPPFNINGDIIFCFGSGLKKSKKIVFWQQNWFI